MRVIYKALDGKIYIWVIDYHEITDAPSVIAREVTQTTAGKVIIILN